MIQVAANNYREQGNKSCESKTDAEVKRWWIEAVGKGMQQMSPARKGVAALLPVRRQFHAFSEVWTILFVYIGLRYTMQPEDIGRFRVAVSNFVCQGRGSNEPVRCWENGDHAGITYICRHIQSMGQQGQEAYHVASAMFVLQCVLFIVILCATTLHTSSLFILDFSRSLSFDMVSSPPKHLKKPSSGRKKNKKIPH